MKTGTVNKQDKANLTLGIFIDAFGGYQEAILNGITQVAEEYNANALCFVGGALEDVVAFRRHWNAIYKLASPTNIDGLIVFSGAMQSGVTIEKFRQFCACYAPLPTISIALELEGIPSVTIDNAIGLRDLMRHLIEHHHYERIAFIRGIDNNPEADVRYQTYAETLTSHSIPFDPELVTRGDCGVESGIEAVKLLLDQRKMSFEAIVATNDYMAMGACQALIERGLSVPEDVAVAGFDDVREAGTFVVPLTTIHQSLTEQGRQAARMLLEHLLEGAPLQDSVVSTELIIRESCGCTALRPDASVHAWPTCASKEAPAQQRDRVLASIRAVICPYFPNVSPRSIQQLVDAFLDSLQGKDSSPFLLLLGRLLRQGAGRLSPADLEQGVMSRWQDALSILRKIARGYRQSHVSEDVDDLLDQGCILVNQAAAREYHSLHERAETSMSIQMDVIRDINTAPTVQQVADVLAENLSRLGINTCALALYEGGLVPSPLSRLIMAYHDRKKLVLEPDRQLFPSKELIPSDLLPRSQRPFLAVQPLLARDIHFGFILTEAVARQWSMGNTHMVLAEQIGSALYRAMLQQQNEESNRIMQRRAAELAEANAQLEQFAYVASHDLQEPLRMVTSYLQLVEKRYGNKLDEDGKEFIDYAVDGAKRMKRMIDDLLAYSRTFARSQPLEPTDCEDLLVQTLSNLEVAIRENDALVTHDPLPTIVADGMQLMAVFQNLVGNAIKFHADRLPHIHISAERQKNEWLFSVRDNGIGIAPEYFERIFAIFSRLHTQARYPGTGIGLAICKKVVERHGGRIWVESRPGEGSTFLFSIPVYAPAPHSHITADALHDQREP